MATLIPSVNVDVGVTLPPVLGPVITQITPVPANGSTYRATGAFCLVIGDPR